MGVGRNRGGGSVRRRALNKKSMFRFYSAKTNPNRDNGRQDVTDRTTEEGKTMGRDGTTDDGTTRGDGTTTDDWTTTDDGTERGGQGDGRRDDDGRISTP